MGIIPNILQKYQGQPFNTMRFLLLIKLFMIEVGIIDCFTTAIIVTRIHLQFHQFFP